MKRPAGLPDIDARAPEGTPERAAQRVSAAWLVTPYAGGRPMGYLVGSQMQEAQNDPEVSLGRILADRRKKAAALPVFEKLTKAQVDAALRAPTPKADQLAKELKAMRDLPPEVRDMKLD